MFALEKRGHLLVGQHHIDLDEPVAFQFFAGISGDYLARLVPLELRFGRLDAKAAPLVPDLPQGPGQGSSPLQGGSQLRVHRLGAPEHAFQLLVVKPPIAADQGPVEAGPQRPPLVVDLHLHGHSLALFPRA